MDEVEASRKSRQLVVGLFDGNVLDTESGRVLSGLIEHPFGNINADDASAPSRDRKRQPSDAAAEIKRSRGTEVWYEMLSDDVPNSRNVFFAALKEFGTGFMIERPLAHRVDRLDTEVGVLGSIK